MRVDRDALFFRNPFKKSERERSLLFPERAAGLEGSRVGKDRTFSPARNPRPQILFHCGDD